MDALDADLLTLQLAEAVDDDLLLDLEEYYTCAVCGEAEGDDPLVEHYLDGAWVLAHDWHPAS